MAIYYISTNSEGQTTYFFALSEIFLGKLRLSDPDISGGLRQLPILFSISERDILSSEI